MHSAVLATGASTVSNFGWILGFTIGGFRAQDARDWRIDDVKQHEFALAAVRLH